MAPAYAVALGLVLVGCSSAAAKEPAASTVDSEVSQIAAVLFGTGDLPSSDQLAEQRAENAAFEDRIAQCMAQAGFDYQPVNYDVLTYDEPEIDHMSREYAEQFGFGYTTTLEDGYDTAVQVDDPNQAYLESLSPAESELYWATLYGEPVEYTGDEEGMEEYAFDPAAAGCQGAAMTAESIAVNDFWSTKGDEMGELYDAAENSQLVQAPLAAWQTCMAGHGHSFTTPDDFDSVMDPYMSRLYESAVYPGADLSEEDMMAMSEDELNALWSQPPTYDQDLLAEAQAYELELATTSWDCGMEELYSAYMEALRVVQEQFIEANLGELRTLVTDR